MISAWVATLIGVLGTLSAGVVSGLFHLRQLAVAHRRTMQGEALTALANLVKALDRHRAQMWLAENERLAGRETVELVDATHETRAGVSEPLTRVRSLLGSLADIAAAAAQTTNEMFDSPDLDELKARRLAALNAVDQLVTTAADHFARMGIGLPLPADRPIRKGLFRASR